MPPAPLRRFEPRRPGLGCRCRRRRPLLLWLTAALAAVNLLRLGAHGPTGALVECAPRNSHDNSHHPAGPYYSEQAQEEEDPAGFEGTAFESPDGGGLSRSSSLSDQESDDGGEQGAGESRKDLADWIGQWNATQQDKIFGNVSKITEFTSTRPKRSHSTTKKPGTSKPSPKGASSTKKPAKGSSTTTSTTRHPGKGGGTSSAKPGGGKKPTTTTPTTKGPFSGYALKKDLQMLLPMVLGSNSPSTMTNNRAATTVVSKLSDRWLDNHVAPFARRRAINKLFGIREDMLNERFAGNGSGLATAVRDIPREDLLDCLDVAAYGDWKYDVDWARQCCLLDVFQVVPYCKFEYKPVSPGGGGGGGGDTTTTTTTAKPDKDPARHRRVRTYRRRIPNSEKKKGRGSTTSRPEEKSDSKTKTVTKTEYEPLPE